MESIFQKKKIKRSYQVSGKFHLPEKGFKVIIIKMLNELQIGVDKHSENFNKEMGNIRKYPNKSKKKNAIAELKNILKELTTD